jgi:hypothetical protein
MAYICDTCDKSYKTLRNLRRDIKEKHTLIEYLVCTEEKCTSRFIRRSYLSKHLILKHKYSSDIAIELALSAERSNTNKGYYEDVSADENIFDLIAEKNSNTDNIQFANSVNQFDVTLLQESNVDTGNNMSTKSDNEICAVSDNEICAVSDNEI